MTRRERLGEDKARINYFLRGSVRQIFACCCCSVVWREGLAGSQGHIVWGCQASLTAGPNGCTLYPLLIDPPTTLPPPPVPLQRPRRRRRRLMQDNDWQGQSAGGGGDGMVLCRMIKSASAVPAPPPTPPPREPANPLSPKPHPPSCYASFLPDILVAWLTCDRGNVTISKGARGDGRPAVIQMSAHAAACRHNPGMASHKSCIPRISPAQADITQKCWGGKTRGAAKKIQKGTVVGTNMQHLDRSGRDRMNFSTSSGGRRNG